MSQVTFKVMRTGKEDEKFTMDNSRVFYICAEIHGIWVNDAGEIVISAHKNSIVKFNGNSPLLMEEVK